MSNVSLSHEAPLEVLRQHPEAVLDLLQIASRRAVPKAVVELLDSELTEAVPSVRRADLVVLVRDLRGQARQCVIVEIQRERDDEKLLAWPLYIAYLHARHRVPTTLLVLTFDGETARWARKRRRVGPSLAFLPMVLDPSDFPAIATIEPALANPELGMLTALARLGDRDAAKVMRHEAEIARVFEAMLRAESSRVRRVYLSLLHGTARGALRSTLEKLMEAYGMGALEMIFNDGKAEGRAEGEAEGRAQGKAEGRAEGKAEGEALALLKVLRTRGLGVDAATELRIRETRDLELLDRWLERALGAASIDEVFAG